MTEEQLTRIRRTQRIIGLHPDDGKYRDVVADALRKHAWRSLDAARHLNETLDLKIAKLC